VLQPIWERVVDRAETGAGDALLEVVAGEGQLGLLGLQRAGRFGSLTLTDISPAVVQHLRSTLLAELGSNVAILQSPAETLDGIASELIEGPLRYTAH